MAIVRVFELPNIGDTRKSFYGKAQVIENSNKIQLQSYDTIVAEIVDDKVTVFDTYSDTTLRHIRSFLKFYNKPNGSKMEIMEMYGKDLNKAETL